MTIAAVNPLRILFRRLPAERAEARRAKALDRQLTKALQAFRSSR